MNKSIIVYLSFIIGIFSSHLACGQRKQIDSLLNVLKIYAKNDTVKVNLLVSIAYAYYRNDADSTLFFANEGIELSRTIKYPIGEARSLRQLSLAYWVLGEYNKTIQYAQQAIDIYQQHNDLEGVSSSYNIIGLVYYRKKEYANALNYFEKGLEIDKKYNFKRNIAIKLTNIGIIYAAQKANEKALLYFNQSLDLSEQIAFHQFIAITTRHIGDVYLQQKNFTKAQSFAKKTLKVAHEVGSNREITLAYLLSGNIAKAQKDFQKAEILLLKALEYAHKNKELEHNKEVAEALYLLYKDKKNDTKALKYHELLKIYQDCLASDKVATEVRNLEYSYQLKMREKEIDLLRKDNLLQDEDSNKQKILLITLSFILLISIFFGLLVFKNRQKIQRTNQLLSIKNREISQKTRELTLQAEQLQADNKLKNKLFSIISHDLRSPLNSLQGILELVSLGGVEAHEVEILYNNIGKQVTALQNTLTNLLEWVKSQMTGETPNRILFPLHELVEEKIALLEPIAESKDIVLKNEVPKDVVVFADKNHIRTILRNLIANAIKFTRENGSVTIKTKQTDNEVIIEIIDTGIGISEEQLKKLFNHETHFSTQGVHGERGTGLGLLLVKDFVEKNNGTITIKSEEDKGSSFILTFPSQ